MSVSTADRFNLSGALVSYIPYSVKASEVIYSGIMVMVVADDATTTTTGDQLLPAADTANGKVVGLSMQSVTGGATDGAVTCNVQPIGASDGGRYWELDATTDAAQNDADTDFIGKLMYALDDHTVGLYAASTNKVVVGRCVQVTYPSATTGAAKVLVDTLQRA